MSNHTSGPAVSDHETEGQLMARWRLGDRRAAAILLGRHLPSARAYLARREPAHVDDLTQHAAELCFVYEASVLQSAAFAPYFSTVVRHLLGAHRRRRGPSLVPLRPDAELMDRQERPDDALALRRTRDAVRRALSGAPPEVREVMTLKFHHDLSGREVAVRLGIPEGTVRSRLRRGYAHLRHRLLAMGVDCPTRCD